MMKRIWERKKKNNGIKENQYELNGTKNGSDEREDSESEHENPIEEKIIIKRTRIRKSQRSKKRKYSFVLEISNARKNRQRKKRNSANLKGNKDEVSDEDNTIMVANKKKARQIVKAKKDEESEEENKQKINTPENFEGDEIFEDEEKSERLQENGINKNEIEHSEDDESELQNDNEENTNEKDLFEENQEILEQNIQTCW